jgi:hypothetical protein
MTPLGCQGNNQNPPATESETQAAQATENFQDSVERSASKPPAAAPTEAPQQVSQSGTSTTDTEQSQGSVNRSTPQPSVETQQKEAVEQSGTPMTDKVMQTQRGPDGMKVNLIKADVTGKLLTVEIQYVYPEGKGGAYASASTDYHIKDVSYIDTATSKIYGVVKEKSGSWMAAPLNDKEKVRFYLSSGNSKTVWFMFPAPSPETNFISLNVPGVGPFKVKVRR